MVAEDCFTCTCHFSHAIVNDGDSVIPSPSTSATSDLADSALLALRHNALLSASQMKAVKTTTGLQLSLPLVREAELRTIPRLTVVRGGGDFLFLQND